MAEVLYRLAVALVVAALVLTMVCGAPSFMGVRHQRHADRGQAAGGAS